MRIFIQHRDAAPDQAVRQALDILVKAGIYSAEGGGTINNRALILINEANLHEALAALQKAGLEATVG